MAIPSGPATPSSEAERAMFDFVDAYDRAYETAAAQHDLTVAQACVLGRVAAPRGMRDLADELGCDASNITQIVSRLEARELIERSANPEDRRSRILKRTAAGDALNTEFETSFEFARNAASGLTPEEQSQFVQLLRKVLEPAADASNADDSN
ncbi:MarR family transcriptional regulator [Epidermidibacterium keratini]|uniref:MarR family transcriptional regulator n=1 Tax=Epidermidibacterium keratini TaxID=1891644 RepID=A0A7L4YLW2_9ACTN|nr:MarR family winged helix-turn-helix transcriptional regulator [Epidermidibacterium keratini]QHB99536.1 MarR family transcriptional regulator [Epidermidibacterium keratini]